MAGESTQREPQVSDGVLASWYCWERMAREGRPGALAALASLERLMAMEMLGTAI